MYFYHNEGQRYQAHAGVIVRMIHDMAVSDSTLFVIDAELDQSRLWNTPKYERGMRDVWNEEDYFRVPAWENAGGERFNLTETSKKIFLHPGKVPQ